MEDDRGRDAPPARAFAGEPVQVAEIPPAHRGGCLDLEGGHAVRAFREDVDLAPPLVPPVVEAEIALLKGRRAQELGEDETLQQPAERRRVGVRVERPRRQAAQRRGDAGIGEMVFRVPDLAPGLAGRPGAQPDDHRQPPQHVEIPLDRGAPQADEFAQLGDVDLRSRADGEPVDQAPQRVGLAERGGVGGVAVRHRVGIAAADPLPPPDLEVPDAGEAPFEDEVDISRPVHGVRRRQAVQLPRLGDRPVEEPRRPPRQRFRHGHRPQRQRQDPPGERVGDVLRGEQVGGPREHEPPRPVVEVDDPLDRQRQLPGALRLVDDQRRARRRVGELPHLPPRVALDRLEDRAIVERDEPAGPQQVPDQRRLADLAGADDVDHARPGQRVPQIVAQMAGQEGASVGHGRRSRAGGRTVSTRPADRMSRTR